MYYPLLFKPNLHTVVWGGQRLRQYKGMEPNDEPIGESWEVSAVPSSTSIVANGPWTGKLLTEVIDEAPEDILGKAVNKKYGGKLPLLVKFIDAKRDLSIQVHPNDEMAQREHGKMGKSEMWYVIRADEGSYLYAGFNKEITPEEYQQRVSDGTIVDVLSKHYVSPGDVFYLPAGRVHAICGGIMLAEVQQSSDVTYRIFDYNRPGLDGKPRELHTKLAAQALDYHVESMCIEGDCKIVIRSTGDEIVLHEGNSTLIPAAIADFDIIPLNGKSKTIDAFIDNNINITQKVTRFLHITKQ